ncbi:unnamed protein product [Owenia fusiformis]|uniref:Uncharacterized protein n=1 Tax=Owenia fusiformis TaxID=6347 RepID=A0A8J1T7N1_OWEFU|nr:unnamed protein product [Owenia fusiformis]
MTPHIHFRQHNYLPHVSMYHLPSYHAATWSSTEKFLALARGSSDSGSRTASIILGCSTPFDPWDRSTCFLGEVSWESISGLLSWPSLTFAYFTFRLTVCLV